MKIVLLVLALGSVPAWAQETCPTAPPLDAGVAAADAPMLKLGQAVSFALKPAPQVHFAVAARRADDPKALGGVAAFTVAAAPGASA